MCGIVRTVRGRQGTSIIFRERVRDELVSCVLRRVARVRLDGFGEILLGPGVIAVATKPRPGGMSWWYPPILLNRIAMGRILTLRWHFVTPFVTRITEKADFSGQLYV